MNTNQAVQNIQGELSADVQYHPYFLVHVGVRELCIPQVFKNTGSAGHVLEGNINVCVDIVSRPDEFPPARKSCS